MKKVIAVVLIVGSLAFAGTYQKHDKSDVCHVYMTPKGPVFLCSGDGSQTSGGSAPPGLRKAAYVTVPDPIVTNIDENGVITMFDVPANGGTAHNLIPGGSTTSIDIATGVFRDTVAKALTKVKQ